MSNIISPYARKITSFRELLTEHNSEVEDKVDRLNVDEIVSKLKSKLGGTTERALRNAKFEHLTSIGVPQMLAETACKEIFRKNGDLRPYENKPKKTKPLNVNRVNSFSFVELFENYDPTGETNPAVRDRLARETSGMRFIVFDPADETKVLANESAKALRQLKDGMPEQESVRVGGKLVKLYRVGENPNEYRDENFLYPGEMLRDGVCDNTGRNLNEIPFEARQVVYLAITETDEVSVDDVEAAHRVLDTLDCEDAIDKAQARYGKAALLLQELKITGDDPKLKIKKGKKNDKWGANSSNDPFNTGRHIST